MPGEIHDVHPCASPFGRPAVVRVGYPADLSLPDSPHWCLSPESASRALLASSLILARFAGQPKLSSLRSWLCYGTSLCHFSFPMNSSQRVCPEQSVPLARDASQAGQGWQAPRTGRFVRARAGRTSRVNDLNATAQARIRHRLRQPGRTADLHSRRLPRSARALGSAR